jgi:protein-tyrosine phosphatase
MEKNANKITHGLWLGNKFAAKDKQFLEDNNIKYIINVSDHIDNYFQNNFNYKYLRVPINNKDSDIIILKEYLDVILDFINEAIVNNNNILIHCKKGHRRSAIIVAYYLMKKYNCSFEMAKIKIQSKRNNTLKEPLILKDAILNK